MDALRRLPWLVLAATCGVVILNMGIRQTFGLYLRPMSLDMGWGREVFAFAIAIQSIVWGLTQPLAGGLSDKYGAGKVLLLGALVYALGVTLMAHSGSPGMLTLSAGVLVGAAQSGTGFAVTLGAISRAAPPHRRSLFMGIATGSASFGQALMLPAGQGLISGLGWQPALTFTGLLALIMLPLAPLLAGRPQAPARGSIAPLKALRVARGQGRYLLLVSGFYVCGFHVAFIGTHLPAYLVDNGIAPGIAALALSMIGLCNIAGALLFGYLGGRASKKKTLCAIYLGRAAVITAFLVLPISSVSVLLFAGAMGFLWLGTVPLTSGLVGQMYGVRYLGVLFGVVFLGHQLGAFTGVWLGGLLYDLTGGYTAVWWAAAALGLFAAVIHWPIDEKTETDLELVGEAA